MRYNNLFETVARQVSRGIRVSRTPNAGLAKKVFTDNATGMKTVALQQNPNTRSEWAQLAREGHEVVQFKQNGRYVGVSVDGKFKPY